ncbi:hypothetical protein CI238_08932 [Colletotrichum incanum]|uniref:Uncharacterized protein n=1 Tax=Colletotrichum incanum TaxID=1573173 RepID=A0A167A1V7_COLIC|nr:hypothetical protein CI238_08932 [Colletotrichum incanum]
MPRRCAIQCQPGGVLSEGDKRDSKSYMPEIVLSSSTISRGRGYFAPEPASRTRPRRTYPTIHATTLWVPIRGDNACAWEPGGFMGLSWSRLLDTVTLVAVEKSSLFDHSFGIDNGGPCVKGGQQVECLGPEGMTFESLQRSVSWTAEAQA